MEYIEKPTHAHVLGRIEAAKTLLFEAKTLLEVHKLIAMAKAAEIYSAEMKVSDEIISYAKEIRIRAERRLGELLRTTPKNKGGNPNLTPADKEEVPTLEQLNLTYKESSRYQKYAKMPDCEFEKMLTGNILAKKTRKSPKQKVQGETPPLDKTSLIEPRVDSTSAIHKAEDSEIRIRINSVNNNELHSSIRFMTKSQAEEILSMINKQDIPINWECHPIVIEFYRLDPLPLYPSGSITE